MNRSIESKRENVLQQTNKALFGQNMTFAAKEAYKLLRTNLLFSLTETSEGKAHIIGVTSSIRGEGKSTTTINLAGTLAEQGERVLVIEGDMRLPSLHQKMEVKTKPGLSNVLVTKNEPTRFLQTVDVGYLNEKKITIDVLTAGEIPPNPSELLGSDKMKRILEHLSNHYNFILVDLPPVTAVTDALVVTKLVNGVIMVVRDQYTESRSLKDALRQLKMVDAKILGFVYTCAGGSSKGYGKKYKYRYYKDYGYRR